MSDRQKTISRLIADRDYRADYIRAKLDVLVPSQLRALRLRWQKTQPELARLADMKQSRISAMETPGKVNFNRETLVRMAATLSVGIKIQFIPFSEMLEWENNYSQDTFDVTQLADDVDFLEARTPARKRQRRRNPHLRQRAPRPQVTSVPVTEIRAGTLGGSQQGSQMNLEFATAESQVRQAPAPSNLIPLPTKTDIVEKALAAAVGGAGGIYGR
jgi:Helix-turn-helix domain